MASANSITPFPSDQDRDAFGHWLAGFCDGEASFILGWDIRKDTGTAMFRVVLRYDDTPILEDIQRFLGCGWIARDKFNRSSPNAMPSAVLCVSKAVDLAGVVVPTFDRYPLRAKKRGDFAIWTRGVEIVSRVVGRGKVRTKSKGGFEKAWKPDDKKEFRSLMLDLREHRKPTPLSANTRPLEPPMPLFADMDPAVLYPSRSSA